MDADKNRQQDNDQLRPAQLIEPDPVDEDDDEVSLPLSAAREGYRRAAALERQAPDSGSDNGEDDDEVSLPLSAAREGYRRATAPERQAPDSGSDNGEDDDDVSLPLSANRDDGDPGYADPAPVIPPQPEDHYRPLPQQDKLTVRSLMECALMVALSLVLALVGSYVPLLNIIGLLLFPLPLAVLVFRNGLKVGLIGTAALFALAALFFGLPSAVIMMIEHGLLGIFLGYCFRRQKKPLFTLGFATVIAACGTLVGLMLSLFIAGLPFSALTEELTLFAEDYFALFNNPSMAALMPGNMTTEAFVEEMTAWMIRLIPALLIIGSMVMAAVAYGVSAAVLRHLHYNIAKVPPFRDWRMDWRFSWGVIAGLAAALAGSHFAVPWLETLGWNILYVFCPVLLVCGLAFVIWMFKQPVYSPILKTVLILMMIFFFQATFFLLLFLAVFEPILDFRGRMTKAMEKADKYRR